MKSLLSMLTLILPLVSYAENGSGGVGPRPEMGMIVSNPEIVFNLGEVDGKIHFTHGQLVGNRWDIQKVEVPKSELAFRPDLKSALQESKIKGNWATFQ